jgi:hypothetical protein
MTFLFGCHHKRTSFPITLPERARKVPVPYAASAHRTYITCLDCGREIPYSWDDMKVISQKSSGSKLEMRSTAA